MVAISITADTRQVKKFIGDMEKRAKDPSRVMKSAAVELDGLIQKRVFRAETDPWGKPWPKLKPETVKQKGSSKILLDRGLLRNSVTIKAVKTDINIGIDGPALRYGSVHQNSSPTKGIARRAFLPIGVDGQPRFDTGWPLKWFTKTVRRLEGYIVEGKTR